MNFTPHYCSKEIHTPNTPHRKITNLYANVADINVLSRVIEQSNKQ
jgi:hypothetical protein